MTEKINIYDAKTQLSRLVDDAANGRTVIIAKNGHPLAQLGPIGGARGRKPRELGQLAQAAKGVDWVQWWREWKASDKEIENQFDSTGRTPPLPARGKAVRKRQVRKHR